MPIFDFFKKKKKPEKEKKQEPRKQEPKKLVVKEKSEVVEKEKILKESRDKVIPKRKKKPGQAYRILKAPHITEKATFLAAKNQYVFKVFPKANKTEIKKAIKSVYGVDVLDVKIINIPKKRKRLGKFSGWKKGYKKAIVKIKQNQKIEVLPK